MRRPPIRWCDPIAAAQQLLAGDRCFALLYSGMARDYTGRYSYLAFDACGEVKGADYAPLAQRLSQLPESWWCGYIGYEMLHATESLPQETQQHIVLPALWFSRFRHVLRFDHEQQEVSSIGEPFDWPVEAGQTDAALPAVRSLTSPMSKSRYLKIVRDTRGAIVRGDFYQANITRKFTGEFTAPPDGLALFRRLCEVSPAPYSALLRLNDSWILSSSPERFMTVDAAGQMQTRPIKGTAARQAAGNDEATRSRLQTSEKDRAENLMIVDLMRNDFSRSAMPGSVKVDRLFDISSYATLHHMESTVSALKRPDIDTLDAVALAFPPGSMTGAPKIKAMEWCLAHEGITRGIYSGALGWIGGDGACDLSVVIRTLVVQGTKFEFQVGGAIVADSEPEAEWRETLTKARGIMAALNADMALLENL